MIVELTGFEGDVRWDSSKPDGQPRRCLDVSRAKDWFTAKVGFKDGLRRTIDWYEHSNVLLQINILYVYKKYDGIYPEF